MSAPVRPPQIAADALVLRLTVPRDFAGARLDRFLCTRLKRLSRSRIQEIIRTRVFTTGGRPLRPASTVAGGDEVVLYRTPPVEPEVPRRFDAVYEDADVVVVDKPAGLPVHPTGRYFRNTLTALLRERYPSEPVRICHRLDRETSGLLVCARHGQAESAIKRQFQARTVDKTYLAIVRGYPDPPEGVIDRPLELETGGALRVKMRIVPEGRGLPSVTYYRVVQRAGDFALVELSPRTGRQHQIRAHLDAIGHPVVGDKLYGGDGSAFLAFLETGQVDPALLLARQALHAHRVAFDHPRTGERQSFVSPLPADLAEFLQGASP